MHVCVNTQEARTELPIHLSPALIRWLWLVLRQSRLLTLTSKQIGAVARSGFKAPPSSRLKSRAAGGQRSTTRPGEPCFCRSPFPALPCLLMAADLVFTVERGVGDTSRTPLPFEQPIHPSPFVPHASGRVYILRLFGSSKDSASSPTPVLLGRLKLAFRDAGGGRCVWAGPELLTTPRS